MNILEMNIGSVLVFGSYTTQTGISFLRTPHPNDLEWIKVSNQNHFMAAKTVESLEFDSQEYRSHNRERRSHGNNFFPQSNIFQFLNSRESRFYKDAHPTDSSPYYVQNGFLREFEDWEIDLMEKQTVVINVPSGSKKEFGTKPYSIECLVSIPSAADLTPREYWGDPSWENEYTESEACRLFQNGTYPTRTAAIGSSSRLIMVSPGRASYSPFYADRQIGYIPMIKLRGDAEVLDDNGFYVINSDLYDKTCDTDSFRSVLTAYA